MSNDPNQAPDAQGINELTNIPKDLAVIKMDNENMMAMAAAQPRNMMQIKEEMVAQLQAFPVFAQAAVYSKPVGNGKMVRGLSVRAAEALCEAYGYCRVTTNAEPVYRDGVEVGANVSATFTDFQKGRVWTDQGFLSKWYTAAGGKGRRCTPDDRFWNVSVKAELSRRVREVILRMVPPGMKMELQSIAEREMTKTLTDADVQKIIVGFEKFNVGLAQLETLLGKTLDAGWNAEDRMILVGAYNGLDNGDTTIGELFDTSKPKDEGDRSSELSDQLDATPDKPAETTEQKPASKPKSTKKTRSQQKPTDDNTKTDEPKKTEEKKETETPPEADTETAEPIDVNASPAQNKAHGQIVERIGAAKSATVLARIEESLQDAVESDKITQTLFLHLRTEVINAHKRFE